MKKSLKNLGLKKETISKLELTSVKGGLRVSHCCPTNEFNSCAPRPGMQCY